MGLSSKQVSSDLQAWNHSLLKATAFSTGSGINGGSTWELPKPPMKRKQQNQQQPEQLKCPRCDSTNTKFCYYNNYNKSQPRHFCKACKRHWTKGGTLRNVPVGDSRKNKRIKTSSASTATPASTSNTKALGFSAKISHTPIGFQAQDQMLSFPLGIGDDENNINGQTLNQTILKPQSLLKDYMFDSSVNLTTGKSLSSNNDHSSLFLGNSAPFFPQSNEELGFPYQSLGSLEENFSCSILSSSTPSSLYGYASDQSTSLEDTIIAGLDGAISYSSMNDQPLKSVDATSNLGWEDVDRFVSSDVAISWDDSEINYP